MVISALAILTRHVTATGDLREATAALRKLMPLAVDPELRAHLRRIQDDANLYSWWPSEDGTRPVAPAGVDQRGRRASRDQVSREAPARRRAGADSCVFCQLRPEKLGRSTHPKFSVTLQRGRHHERVLVPCCTYCGMRYVGYRPNNLLGLPLWFVTPLLTVAAVWLAADAIVDMTADRYSGLWWHGCALVALLLMLNSARRRTRTALERRDETVLLMIEDFPAISALLAQGWRIHTWSDHA